MQAIKFIPHLKPRLPQKLSKNLYLQPSPRSMMERKPTAMQEEALPYLAVQEVRCAWQNGSIKLKKLKGTVSWRKFSLLKNKREKGYILLQRHNTSDPY